ncbi:MBL fold metallo-hydrolase [Hyphobacterium sp. Y6023]|uniref:MBL fold metallo-hydrolase n=2 Tax=Hyphobacterium marinum TaxID=3116574 RepID=A0ABU7M0F5_9PROT|nr:MBL fold metallo-hydrolase [Hyphobacterium sp. Y6023]MEE2566745.1 MBL fold metallo-hydrolase [Hyphobacterium sp. Y6023]
MMDRPDVTSFFHNGTNTVSHVVADPETRRAAIVDPVLDYCAASGRTATTHAERVADHVREAGLTVDWILETHIHADHLSAAPWLKTQLGGKIAIGENVREVQRVFGKLFGAEAAFRADGSQFDHLFTDGETFQVGNIEARAIWTPGHTPACMSFLIGDAVFVGDTLFMPDFGTARCDFPGGDARQLYQSIHRLYELPDETRMFLCHDYETKGRDGFAWETTVGAQKRGNIHVREGVSEDEFVAMRTARDKTLAMPQLILPSVQINMRAGEKPPPDESGQRYIKIPLDAL